MSSEVSMSEHVNIIILNDLLVVVCLKVNQIYFFWQYCLEDGATAKQTHEYLQVFIRK